MNSSPAPGAAHPSFTVALSATLFEFAVLLFGRSSYRFADPALDAGTSMLVPASIAAGFLAAAFALFGYLIARRRRVALLPLERLTLILAVAALVWPILALTIGRGFGPL